MEGYCSSCKSENHGQIFNYMLKCLQTTNLSDLPLLLIFIHSKSFSIYLNNRIVSLTLTQSITLFIPTPVRTIYHDHATQIFIILRIGNFSYLIIFVYFKFNHLKIYLTLYKSITRGL
ncbi:hypothetical protein RF11_14948 [Thelohanellus kitauei]|uniref:Uncharacterized protein n=1 Tax=Thelohanellus kitauei TaxID=669202 RepID=A0A0C2JN47_THEKT|nr:hypothetical protein RF11_14948 [Thelohanellus kitauei]